MQLHEFLICLAIALAGMGLFRQNSATARKFALLLFWLGSGIGVYFLTDKIGWAVVILLAWIMLPLTEILIVLRKLRVPQDRQLRDAHPPIEEFPTLREITQEFVELGFEKVDDCDLTPHFHETYYRLFHHSQFPAHGVIGFVSQGEIGFSFHCFFSEGVNGKLWLTWDYPLTYGLKIPPNIALYRLNQAQTIEELWKEHQAFLQINQVLESDLLTTRSVEGVRERLSRLLKTQLDFNVQEGILFPETSQELQQLRYSWRGIWFVTRQMIRDLIR